MARGERLIKLGNSWFSVKSIEVERDMIQIRGRALDGFRVALSFTEPN